MLNAGDVEEVIFVVISEVTLHLRRVHSAIRLRHVNRRHSERRKNIARHPLQGDPCAERDGNHQHDNGDGTAQRWGGQVHSAASFTTSSYNSSTWSRTNASTLRPAGVRR